MHGDEIMACAALGMPIDYAQMAAMQAGWEGSPCGESTPMSMAMSMEGGSAGSTRSHARGRRARRRKQREQKPGFECDGEDVSDDEETTATYSSMSGTPLGEVAFVSASNAGSTNASPTGASFGPQCSPMLAAWNAQCEARALGPVATDHSFAAGQRVHRRGGGGDGKNVMGSCENDPRRANALSAPLNQMNEPMKVTSYAAVQQQMPTGAGGADFTRDDFLSLEVGGGGAWLPAGMW